MKVIASKPGFYGQLRTAGDVFDVPEGETATWFAPLADAELPAKPKGKAPKTGGNALV